MAPTHPPVAAAGRTLASEMSASHAEPNPTEDPELPVEELLRRARPLPSHEERVIDDLTTEEADAFLAAVLS